MSDSLIKKVELFERLAVLGDRGSFLKSLAQREVGDAAIATAVKAADDAIVQWIQTSAEKQPNLPSGELRGLPTDLANAAAVIKNYVSAKSFTAADLAKLQKAATRLSAFKTFNNMGENALNAWASNVFPATSHLLDLVQKQSESLAQFSRDYPVPSQERSDEEIAASFPHNNKLTGTALSVFFQKVYKAVRSGQQPSAADLATWQANSQAFKGRAKKLGNDIAKYEDNPYQNANELAKWKAEKNAIDLVVSKLG